MARKTPTRRALQAVAYEVFRSRPLAEMLFGVKFRPVGRDFYYFDTTTYVTTRRVQRSLTANNTVVDMGTGTAAAVGLYVWKNIGCRVISVDINPTMVQMSTESVKLNHAPIQVIQSSFFDNVKEPFDTVIFNPPYVPTNVGLDRQLSDATRSQWDGGPAGTDVIHGFLDAVAALPHEVTVYMGINDWHVGQKEIFASLRERGLILEEVTKPSVLPVYVYVFKNNLKK